MYFLASLKSEMADSGISIFPDFHRDLFPESKIFFLWIKNGFMITVSR
jgi:hypothetical protein